MKILMFAPGKSIHTHKWATYLTKKGYQIKVATFNNHYSEAYAQEVDTEKLAQPLPGKWFYMMGIYSLHRLIRQFQPDILHAHYLSSYGFMGIFTKFYPYVISVWGSDIYRFPISNLFGKSITKYTLKHADYLCSTSIDMAHEMKKYIDKEIAITPFGVDTEIFIPKREYTKENKIFTVGIVKSLFNLYGFHKLFQAFAELKKQDKLVRLLVVGEGPERDKYQELVNELKIADVTHFAGAVPHREVVRYLQQMDVFVLPSEQESFGVAALEAQACGLPVVINRVGGLPEVIENGKTGILLQNNQPESIYQALEFFRRNPQKRREMGKQAVHFVQKNYSWDTCGQIMENLYQTIIDKKNKG
jgi:L-malate glycosyltransferase